MLSDMVREILKLVREAEALENEYHALPEETYSAAFLLFQASTKTDMLTYALRKRSGFLSLLNDAMLVQVEKEKK